MLRPINKTLAYLTQILPITLLQKSAHKPGYSYIQLNTFSHMNQNLYPGAGRQDVVD